MMRRYVPVLVLAVCCLWPTTARAHTDEASGTIHAELHVSPDHKPLSGKPAAYKLTFKDAAGKFTLADCSCMATIVSPDGKRTSQPLQATSPMHSSNAVTFSQPGDHTLIVAGQPKGSANFEPFELTYTIPVYDGATRDQSVPLWLWFAMAGGIGVVLLIAFLPGSRYTIRKSRRQE